MIRVFSSFPGFLLKSLDPIRHRIHRLVTKRLINALMVGEPDESETSGTCYADQPVDNEPVRPGESASRLYPVDLITLGIMTKNGRPIVLSGQRLFGRLKVVKSAPTKNKILIQYVELNLGPRCSVVSSFIVKIAVNNGYSTNPE